MSYSITIPAVTALTGSDATATRAVIAALVNEIVALEKRISALEKVEGMRYDAVPSGRGRNNGVRR